MSYIPNPKTAGSGIICEIPQTGTCPNKCDDCFFQSGRSYLEPLSENLPNTPPPDLIYNHVVRINDGLDSNINRDLVIGRTKHLPFKFYNTAIPTHLDEFPGPIVLTINPGKMTDTDFHKLESIPKNLMFVRFRTNTWNLDYCQAAIDYYTPKGVPVVLTFMAYGNCNSIPQDHWEHYILRQRTTNSYWAITTDAWREIMEQFQNNIYVYSCGKIEGELGKTGCKFCGNCIREYFNAMEKINA